MAEDRPLSIDRLPTLTEVLELGHDLPGAFWAEPVPGVERMGAAQRLQPAEIDAAVDVALAPAVSDRSASHIDESAVVARVLAELEPRIANLLEARLREALAPALARAADTLIRETRVELAATTRALVEESLAQALRHPLQG